MSTTPHDTLIKAILGTPAHAATALRAILPSSLSDALDWGALRTERIEYARVDGTARHSDLLFAVPFREEPAREALVYVLFEHQSTEDPLMALRLFVYVARIFEERVLRAGIAAVPYAPRRRESAESIELCLVGPAAQAAGNGEQARLRGLPLGVLDLNLRHSEF